MRFDTTTLTALLCLQLLAMALALTALSGWLRSPGLRWAVSGLWVQIASWLMVLATPWLGVTATALSYALGALTFTMTLQAMQHWLGPRPGLHLAWSLPLLPLGSFTLAAFIDDADLRLSLQRGLPNLAIAGTLGVLLVGLLGSAPQAMPGSRRWRNTLALPLLVLMLLTLWRSAQGFGAEADYPSLRGGHPVAIAVLVAGNLATIVAALGFLAAWRGEAEAQLRQAALQDPLTGLLNRRGMERRAGQLMAHARRHGTPLAALILDLDHFKSINDRHGHAQGDAALVLLADLLQQLQRGSDCCARLGGEEFMLLLDGSDVDGARAFDQRLRGRLKTEALPRLGFALDYSAGMALLGPDDADVQALMRRADAALYRAKAAGRGRLCLHEDDDHDGHPGQSG